MEILQIPGDSFAFNGGKQQSAYKKWHRFLERYMCHEFLTAQAFGRSLIRLKKNQTERNFDALHEQKSRVLINSLQRSWFVPMPMYGYLDSTHQAYRHNGMMYLRYDSLVALRNGETARLFGFFVEWRKNYTYGN